MTQRALEDTSTQSGPPPARDGARPVAWALPSKLRSVATTVGIAVLGFVTLSLALWTVYPDVPAVGRLASGHTAPTTLPWSFGETGGGHRLDLTLRVHWGTPRRWRIIPDDHFVSIRVNGQLVPLSGIPPAALDDWQHGFVLDLDRWLHSGENHLVLVVDNRGGVGGLTMRPEAGWRNLLLALGLLPWLLALARVFRLRRVQTVVLGGALVVLCWYWSATTWSQRSYDVKGFGETGHIDYVVYVAEHGSLPPLDQGWQYYQPPLYYESAALTWRWARRVGLSATDALQAHSLLLWLVFLTASAGALRLTLRRSLASLALATTALALWPSSVMQSVRIGNDVAMYAVAAVCTWFMLHWWRGGRRRDLLGMATCVAVAFGVKSSGVALLTTATALLGLRALRHARWRRPGVWAEGVAAVGIMLGGAALAISRNYHYWRLGKVSNLLVCNIASLDDNLRIKDELKNFIPLDVATFLASPWISSRDDATGRGNVWNYLLRSSLSGEFSFEGSLHQAIALLWGALLLWLVVLLLLRVYTRRPSAASLWRDAPWVLLSVAWLGSLVGLRAMSPIPCQADFRYIVPALVPFVLACTRDRRLPQALLAAMCVSAAVFFVTL